MLQKNIHRNKYSHYWNVLSLLLHFQFLIARVRSDGDRFQNQVVPEDHSRAIIDVLKGNFGYNSELNGNYKDSLPNINNVDGYQNGYYSDGNFVGMSPTLSSSSNSNIGSFVQSQNYNPRNEGNIYINPYNNINQRDTNSNTYDIIYSNNQEKKIPLFLSKSPLLMNGGGNYKKPNYNVGDRQEINKYFSPYSSIHYLKYSEAPDNRNSRWTWNHIEKPILRTSTTRPIEFKHKIPNIDEAWWNVSYNVRKEPRRADNSESPGQNDLVKSQNAVSNDDIERLDSKPIVNPEDKTKNVVNDQIQNQNLSQNHNHSHNHHYHHHHHHKHSHNHKHNSSHKDQINKDEENHIEDEIVKSATVGDVVNLTRLELPNPYDRKVAIDQLISTSLNNLKQENWSIPVEELINATFIHPGTQQPDLVPNQLGPKVMVQDFYCNPQIHKCTNLQAVGTAIGEPIWKIYNTSTIGRAQRRVSNLLDDAEEQLTMGLTQTFIDYIEQEPTIELLESIGKAPTNIFQIPENGSINQFYDNATRLGVFQAAEFINPLPQNKTDQKFANALKKAAIDCLLSNFTLPNCNIPENNTRNEELYGNYSIYQLFKDPKDEKLH
ncbi:uncharacterized protein cubi_03715 [Cryptosporidium ubiquitum]|uniref:Uncharacterized protein n=1 Tax=Cryptosporidium ubiquitum TaxID=857276 RepID=A0A1J4MQF4_9CRYT|nr:uncharacterized protein cubi_03715 [Cryptosporidium ubiquitum]OII75236.1 hypothetical protein cubi_03715 [Cryptosporidium ubiquitum]